MRVRACMRVCVVGLVPVGHRVNREPTCVYCVLPGHNALVSVAASGRSSPCLHLFVNDIVLEPGRNVAHKGGVEEAWDVVARSAWRACLPSVYFRGIVVVKVLSTRTSVRLPHAWP